MFNQQIHGSKRSLRSVEDFTEFEQRTAYFNGDPIHAMKKGLIDAEPRSKSRHMAQLQNMLDFPPAPKLDLERSPRPGSGYAKRTARREAVLRQGPVLQRAIRPRSISTIRCTICNSNGSQRRAPDGPIKTFTLRGIKDSPPYLHDGRCLTLEDTVEFFNLVLELQVDEPGKS